ncbi:MAG TPA: polymer-forming cytoskeletal protein [Pyrinomonadaceae bacterium]|jgi:cytoskeletal protein CcmA (bactofilin family)
MNGDHENNERSALNEEFGSYTSARSAVPSQHLGVKQSDPISQATTSSQELADSASLVQEIREGTLSGFIVGGTVVTGEATFSSVMRVDGSFSGRISSKDGTLIVGATGKVEANIKVAVATIHGNVTGEVIATQRLVLGRASRVNGKIETPSLKIEKGAVFEGSCKMIELVKAAEKNSEPLKAPEDEPPDATRVKSVSAR